MNQSQTITKLSAALSKAQSEFRPVAFDASNAFLKNKYATLGAVIASTRQTLAKHGLAIAQVPVSCDKTIGVETILTHESGEFMSAAIFLPLGDERGKSQAQVAGSILTYLRRYSMSGILGIYADEDDDAGVAPRQIAPTTAAAAPAVYPTEKHRAAMIDRLLKSGLTAATIQGYAMANNIIMPNQVASDDWPLCRCPTNAQQMGDIMKEITAFSKTKTTK